MMRRSPLRAKRPTPRRKAPERVEHERTRPKAGAAPTAAEKAHMARVAAMPCLVGHDCAGRTTVHHPTGSIHGGRVSRSHRRLTPLCERHHLIQNGPHESVEALGHKGFYERYGVDLIAVADRLWEEGNGSH